MKKIYPGYEPIITMKGTIDLDRYCKKCEANEFHSCIGTSCALCGNEIEDGDFGNTVWACSSEEEAKIRSNVKWINERTPRVGFDAYRWETQNQINQEHETFWEHTRKNNPAD